MSQVEKQTCPGCQSELAANLLACPKCHRLVHQEKLKQLGTAATAATASGQLSHAASLWREALELLPPETRQAATIRERITAIRERLDAGEMDEKPPPAPESAPAANGAKPNSGSTGGVLGALALLFWKFKAAAFFALTKAKFLFLGLTKGGTLLTMLVSFGAYWTRWGWQFALGIVVSIYVHEMGHVAQLRRYGMRATAPMFIPFLGALIRLDQYPIDPIEDSRIGLAGPLWGLGAAVAAGAVYWISGSALWGGIAKVGAWINLFNLLPIGSLDGGRGLRAVVRWQRVVIAGLAALCWHLTGEGLLAGIAALVGLRCLEGSPAVSGSRAFREYVFLLITLTALAAIPVTP